MSEYITVVTALDQQEFKIKKDLALMTPFIKDAMEDVSDGVVPLQITRPLLEKILEWCEDGSLEFLENCIKTDNPNKKINQEYLFELLQATDYLDNEKLFDMCCNRVADCIRGKTLEEVKTENGICLECYATPECTSEVCEHGLTRLSYTREEEEKMKNYKPYEEWVKEVGAQ